MQCFTSESQGIIFEKLQQTEADLVRILQSRYLILIITEAISQGKAK